jgi:hypothetical protein
MANGSTFDTWWTALAAVPGTPEELDWWAQPDGRHPRYDRLFRLWSDPTDGCLPHFFQTGKEKHLVATLWENFSLFAPGDAVDALYDALEIKRGGGGGGGRANDVCWSYEYQLGHQDRHVDLVLHVRFDDADEILLAEAKAPGKQFDRKDQAPNTILDREQFATVAKRRRYFLLGDGDLPMAWLFGDHGVIRWERLLATQLELCDRLTEDGSVRQLIRSILSVQYALHGIGNAPRPDDLRAFERQITSAVPTVRSPHCGRYLLSAAQHVRCLCGQGPASGIPFAYLANEPMAKDVTPGWRAGCGGLAVNTQAYWKLPPRVTAETPTGDRPIAASA